MIEWTIYFITYITMSMLSMVMLDYIEWNTNYMQHKINKKNPRYDINGWFYVVIFIVPPVWLYIIGWGIKVKIDKIKFAKGLYHE